MVISLKSFTRGTDAPLVGNIHSAPFLGLRCSVHTEKVENVHAFFGYIVKNPKICTAFSEKFSFTPGILPKKLKPFSLFPNFFENLPIRYISRIFESVQVFQNFFQKNSLSTDDYQKKYPKRSHPFPTFCRKIFISLPAISPTWSDLCAILSLNLPPGK